MKKKIKPDESELDGKWIESQGEVSADSTCERINQLTSEHLTEIATDESGWDTLYRDPVDGRHWELTYPQSNLHGGGPPKLTCLSPKKASEKYNRKASNHIVKWMENVCVVHE